jgi:hypothetical protein
MKKLEPMSGEYPKDFTMLTILSLKVDDIIKTINQLIDEVEKLKEGRQ